MVGGFVAGATVGAMVGTAVGGAMPHDVPLRRTTKAAAALHGHTYWKEELPNTSRLGMMTSVQYVEGELHTCWPDTHGFYVGLRVGVAEGADVVGIEVGAEVVGAGVTPHASNSAIMRYLQNRKSSF
jgi:hypothetical protein